MPSPLHRRRAGARAARGADPDHYPWIEGESYEVRLLTSTGATIAHEIPVAVTTPAADAGFYGLMALLGIYVGVIPVALGMLWLPWVRRIPPDWLRALMALTVGLLASSPSTRRWRGSSSRTKGAAALGGRRSCSSAPRSRSWR